MRKQLDNSRIAFLVATEAGKIQAFNHLTAANTFEADKARPTRCATG